MSDSRAADIVGDFFDSDEWGDLEVESDLDSGESAPPAGDDQLGRR